MRKVNMTDVLPSLLLLLLWGRILTTTAQKIVYPHPRTDEPTSRRAAQQWEPVDEFRERWGISFDYQPVALHPEECRYLTEEECYQADMLKLEYMEKQKQRARQRRTQEEAEVVQDHTLVLLMRWTDHVDRVLPTIADQENLWKVMISDWLNQQSYSKYAPTFDVLDWMDTDNTEEYYSNGDYGFSGNMEQSVFYLLNQLDANPEWDWSVYDTDGDGIVDNLIVLHSGYNAESFEVDCQSQREPEFGIWSHWKFDQTGWVSPTSGHKVQRYMLTSALDEACGSKTASMGIVIMNFMHSLGLVSLYDEGSGIGNGIGKYDMLAYPYGNNNDGHPGSLSSFSKMKLEWIEAIEVNENSYVQLGPWSQQPDAIIIKNKYGPSEYLLMENRQPVGGDEGFFGAGIAIYHIDEFQDGQAAASFPGEPNYPTDHYAVAVLPKDGLYDLEKGTNYGDEGDLWHVGDELGPGMGGTVYPNTDGYQFGSVVENGLIITIVSECGSPTTGKHMVVKITGFGDDEPVGNSECLAEEEEYAEEEENDGGAVERPDNRPEEPVLNETVAEAEEVQTEMPTTATPIDSITNSSDFPDGLTEVPANPGQAQATREPASPTGNSDNISDIGDSTMVPTTFVNGDVDPGTNAPSSSATSDQSSASTMVESGNQGDIMTTGQSVSRPPGSSEVTRPPRPGSPELTKPPRPGSTEASRPPRPGSTEVTKPPHPGSGEVIRESLPPAVSVLSPTASPTNTAANSDETEVSPTSSPSSDPSMDGLDSSLGEGEDGTTATDEVDEGYDALGGSIFASSEYTSASSLLRPPLQGSVVSLPPEKVDKIEIMEEPKATSAAVSSRWRLPNWTIVCSAGWILLSLYTL